MKQIYYSDIKLLQQKIAFDRDERSYKMLFLHFYKPLLIFAERYVKNHETAEEIVSDVMMRLWAINEGLAAIHNLKVYLYMATRNTAINYLSITTKYTHCDIEQADYINSNINNPEEKLLSDELQRKILSAVQQLPPKCQLVYKLVRENGFRYKEVAAVLSISENTVDRHLNNALHKMVKVVKTYVQER